MIQVNHVSKRYGAITAVDDLSFTIEKGEVLGFLGPNGAGKSTTMNMICGYLSSTAGDITVDGLDILAEPLKAKRLIGYLPEHPPLYLDMTVAEYLNFVYQLKGVRLPKQQHIAEICELTRIKDVYHRVIRNLSKGYRQRVGIAQALVGNPPVLILDEPTVGLDPKQIIEIRSLIKALGKNHTVILSSHILSEVQAVCERVIVINKGKLIADDTPEKLAQSFTTDRHYLLRAKGPEKEMLAGISSVEGVAKAVCLGSKEPGSFDFSIEPKENADIRVPLFERMASRKWPILSLRSSDLSLEEIFIKLTADAAEQKEVR